MTADENETETEIEGDDDVTEWADQLAEQAGNGGGCLETAQAAATERHESRRGVVKGLSALLATFGLGASAGTASELPADSDDDVLAAGLPVWWPDSHPTSKPAYICDGTIDTDCVAFHGSGAGIVCLPCAAEPTRISCTVCAANLIREGAISKNQCCSGTWERTF